MSVNKSNKNKHIEKTIDSLSQTQYHICMMYTWYKQFLLLQGSCQVIKQLKGVVPRLGGPPTTNNKTSPSPGSISNATGEYMYTTLFNKTYRDRLPLTTI